MKYVLGIDLGTSGTKTVLFDREGKAPTKQPHCRIRSIPELLDIFPGREAAAHD